MASEACLLGKLNLARSLPATPRPRFCFRAVVAEACRGHEAEGLDDNVRLH